MLKKGELAPSFSLPDSNGDIVSLSDYKGRWLVLYFYPKDNTPGCTLQAVDFTKLYDEFHKLGVEIVGINGDSVESHKEFKDKFNLKTTLLSDASKEVLSAYKVCI